MATEILSAQRLRELLHYDPSTGIFRWAVQSSNRAKAGSVAGHLHSSGYVYIGIDGKDYRAHRLAWLHVHGEWPSGLIDHRDTVRHHNWLSNLRPATNGQNMQNRASLQCNNTSGVQGVWWDKKNEKWAAEIWVDNKKTWLGRFEEKKAAESAVLAAREIHHPFSRVAA